MEEKEGGIFVKSHCIITQSEAWFQFFSINGHNKWRPVQIQLIWCGRSNGYSEMECFQNMQSKEKKDTKEQRAKLDFKFVILSSAWLFPNKNPPIIRKKLIQRCFTSSILATLAFFLDYIHKETDSNSESQLQCT